jgi:hypothetical protein
MTSRLRILAVAAVALAAGALTAGLLAGRKLRQRRWRHQLPYDVHRGVHREAATGTDDYEPVGI